MFIDGQRIAGYEALGEPFGKSVREEGETRYAPLVAAFGPAALRVIAAASFTNGFLFSGPTVVRFVAFSMASWPSCACIGGASDVPLGAISLTENLFMTAMGVRALFQAFGA